MARTVTSDLLGASSLLVTCIGVLYTTWYQEVNAAISLKDLVGKQRDDHRRSLVRLLLMRSLPLAISSLLLAIALVAPTKEVVQNISPRRAYDPVATCFIVVFFVVLLLAVSASALVVRIMRRVKQLK